eukprot:SAG11_NODE_2784_length_2976_cov_2.710115_2_plen_162_part_00
MHRVLLLRSSHLRDITMKRVRPTAVNGWLRTTKLALREGRDELEKGLPCWLERREQMRAHRGALIQQVWCPPHTIAFSHATRTGGFTTSTGGFTTQHRRVHNPAQAGSQPAQAGSAIADCTVRFLFSSSPSPQTNRQTRQAVISPTAHTSRSPQIATKVEW